MFFLNTLKGEKSAVPPLWMMRQAGRYLPGYRALRAQHKGFLSLCFASKDATTVTLEPIDLFQMDAAIVFADILTLPLAFGQDVTFIEGKGPVLGSLPKPSSSFDMQCLDPIMETLRLTRGRLSPEKALIGFAGSPWTVLSYMVEGGSSKSFEAIKAFVYGSPLFDSWMSNLIQGTIAYLWAQIRAGADVVMLFDSWAAQIPHDLVKSCCIDPHVAIVKGLRDKAPHIPIITFPRHLSLKSLKPFVDQVKPTALAVGNSYSPQDYLDDLSNDVILQTGPDPVVLKLGGDLLKRHVDAIKTTFRDRPYIMNLAHGVLPKTPVNHVRDFVSWVRS